MADVPEQHDEALSEEYEQRRAAHPGGLTLRQRIRANRRSLELCVFVFILFGISIFWTSHTAQRVTDQASAVIARACDFWYPLTNVPVVVPAGQKMPSKLSVEIIAGARESYSGQCSPPHPPMPPPDPSFVKWAHVYRIPVAEP